MRALFKFILRPLVRIFYSITKEIIDEEFEQSGINAKNQLHFLNESAIVPASTMLMKNILITNKQNDPSKIKFGEHCRIGTNAELIVFKYGGEINVGSNTLINSNCHLYSMKKITIGNNVLLSYNVSVFDNNSHPLDANKRKQQWTNEEFDKEVECDEVIIEDDVWIGANSIILKGVRIGSKSIIAAGSVVTTNVETMSIFAGNPAKLINKIN